MDTTQALGQTPNDFDLPSGWDEALRLMVGQDVQITTEQQRRFRMIEVLGSDNVRISSQTGSRANWSHLLLVMKQIVPALHQLFGHSMNKSVSIVVAYKRRKQLYIDAIAAAALDKGLTNDELPQVWTIDAAGDHSHDTDVSVVDMVDDTGMEELGRRTADERTEITFTRGRKACLVVMGKPAV
ncbi:hypothetical protein LTR17_003728 [Elasticomyces elasticus]|nr:hypothetical protein LTR17_003728 [Elasticomyces elasticus]